MANRQELEKALQEGCTVVVQDRLIRGSKKELPPGEIEGTIHRDSQGRLTREAMERALKGGGSVLHGGEPVTDLEALPSAAELARGDEVKAQQVRQALLSQRAGIDAELAKLEQPREEAQPQTQAQPQPQPAPPGPFSPQSQPPPVPTSAPRRAAGGRGAPQGKEE